MLPTLLDTLAVKSHQVVHGGDEPGDRGLAADGAMRPVPIVVMQPVRQGLGAFLRVAIETNVRPLEQRGLDEAFGLAIGTGV